MNPVIHFEMPAENSERVAKFYSDVFGWQTQLLGPEMSSYVLATTTESDHKGPKKPGTINGGFLKISTDKPGSISPWIYLVNSEQPGSDKMPPGARINVK